MVLGALATAGVVHYAYRDTSAMWVLTLSVYTFLPWAFLALRAESLGDRARRIALAVLTALTICMFIAVAADGSSTEVLIFIVVPAYQWIALGAITAVVLVARSRRNDHGDPAERSPG